MEQPKDITNFLNKNPHTVCAGAVVIYPSNKIVVQNKLQNLGGDIVAPIDLFGKSFYLKIWLFLGEFIVKDFFC